MIMAAYFLYINSDNFTEGRRKRTSAIRDSKIGICELFLLWTTDPDTLLQIGISNLIKTRNSTTLLNPFMHNVVKWQNIL